MATTQPDPYTVLTGQVAGYDKDLEDIARQQAELDRQRLALETRIAGEDDFMRRENMARALESGYGQASGNLNIQRLGLQGNRRIASDMAFTEQMRLRDLQDQRAEDTGRRQAMLLNTGVSWDKDGRAVELSDAGRQAIGLRPRGAGHGGAATQQVDPLEAQARQTERDIRAYLEAGDEESAKALFARSPHLWERLGVPRTAYEAEPIIDEEGNQIGLRASNIDPATGQPKAPAVDVKRLKPVLDGRAQQYDRQETLGLTGGKGSANRFTTTIVKGPDGRDMVATVDRITGQIVPTDNEAGSKPGAGAGGGQGQTERIAQRILDEATARGEAMTFQEAVGLSKRAPNASAEILRREGLALQAAKAEMGYLTDPDGTLKKWRAHYGLDGAQPAKAAPAHATAAQPAPQVGLAPRGAAPAAPVAQAAPQPQQPAAQPSGDFASPEDVKAAFKAGKLTRDQAKAALKQFGYQ